MTEFISQKSLRELEARCIQEDAPPCQATCPAHVDVRKMMAQLGEGDFAAAYQTFSKSVPFPAIISQVCDQPCHAVCTRGEVGDPIAIWALERACVNTAGQSRPAIQRLPARDKQVAIVGGGLSGSTAAFDLSKKGYHVVVFEAADRLGGWLWDIPEEIISRQSITADLDILDQLEVEIRLDTPVESIDDLLQDFDVVFLGTGWADPTPFGVDCDDNWIIKVDPLTYETSRTGVFAGGSLLRSTGEWSPITSISDGRRAAISIDRYLQGVSLTASRQREGSYSTNLYTNTTGIEPLSVVPFDASDGFSEAAAIQEAQRCIQCECLECVKVCAYLDRYTGYPKQHFRTIYNNLSIVMGERHANTFINSCALCGLCAEVCPTDLDMGSVCKHARQVMVTQERMPPSAHDFALRDMAFSNGDQFAMARHQPGESTSAYLFFPGCQLAGSHPEYVEQVYNYLRANLGENVGLMLGCCGAPADWAGRVDLFEEALEKFQAQHTNMGRPKLVLACSSCFQVFKAELPEVERVSLWELFEELGLPDDSPVAGAKTVAVHDPCTARYETRMHDNARALITHLGYQIEELALSREKTTCCSYGGLMVFADRDLARSVIERRIAESPADYVTYCAICRDFFAAQGKPTLHLLDLIFGQGNGDQAAQRGPGYSQRHENRARLKRKLLKELWGEDVTGQPDYENIKLVIADPVQARLEDRLILVEDIQQVIAHAERTGSKLLNKETGHFLAHLRPASVTYWVEYAPEDDQYIVFNAYSHRMEVAEDVKDE